MRLNLYWRWRRLTGPFRKCRIEDGYCLSHHTGKCFEVPAPAGRLEIRRCRRCRFAHPLHHYQCALRPGVR